MINGRTILINIKCSPLHCFLSRILPPPGRACWGLRCARPWKHFSSLFVCISYTVTYLWLMSTGPTQNTNLHCCYPICHIAISNVTGYTAHKMVTSKTHTTNWRNPLKLDKKGSHEFNVLYKEQLSISKWWQFVTRNHQSRLLLANWQLM